MASISIPTTTSKIRSRFDQESRIIRQIVKCHCMYQLCTIGKFTHSVVKGIVGLRDMGKSKHVIDHPA